MVGGRLHFLSAHVPAAGGLIAVRAASGKGARPLPLRPQLGALADGRGPPPRARARALRGRERGPRGGRPASGGGARDERDRDRHLATAEQERGRPRGPPVRHRGDDLRRGAGGLPALPRGRQDVPLELPRSRPRSKAPRPTAWQRSAASATACGDGSRRSSPAGGPISKRTATTRKATVPWHGDCSGGRRNVLAGRRKRWATPDAVRDWADGG